MRITIETIPHTSQRYDTCGDWQFKPEGLHIKVSERTSPHAEFLIAIHELIEAYLCHAAGITDEQVDAFDIAYEENRDFDNDDIEPGDDPSAPYYRQHQIATGIERLLAAELNVDWLAYEKEMENPT